MMTHRLKYAPFLVAACALLPVALSPAYAQTKSTPPVKTKAKTPAVPAIKARPATVSPATWAKILALKPGMTRADLLQVFAEEGGISSRAQRSYILPKSRDKQYRYLKIDVTFAPDNSPVSWQDEQGAFKVSVPSKPSSPARARPGDVITSLSPVYWDYTINN